MFASYHLTGKHIQIQYHWIPSRRVTSTFQIREAFWCSKIAVPTASCPPSFALSFLYENAI